MKKIDTFSANSLKILDKSTDEFIDKYVFELSLLKKDERANLGQKFHSLICAFLNKKDISQISKELTEKEQIIWKNLKTALDFKKENFIKTEFPFLIKEEFKNGFYFLTGRFDAIYFEKGEYVIYDWKTLNLPKNPSDDLQSVVYLYSLSKIFNTEKIKMRYLSIERLDFTDVEFKSGIEYKKRIDEIIGKYMI